MEATMTKPKASKDPSFTVKQQVLGLLGKPKDLNQVTVQYVYSISQLDKYRVNVFRNINNYPHISDSYFVTCDKSGNIVTSSPEIVKQYQ